VLRIDAGVQRYDWGAPDGIPQLLGITPDGGPYAEAWWGAHPAAPSAVEGGDLAAVIASDPVSALGEDAAQRWGKLPYLLKVLSIARPVSIQVHPTREQAHAINVAHVGAQSPLADDEHKPEMVVALTPMRLQAGFRPVRHTAADLMVLDHPLATVLADVIVQPDGIATYVTQALAADAGAGLLESLTAARDAGLGSDVLRAAADAADAHPGDTGALVALALNVVELAPGQACFTGAGVVHSYHSGLGLEIMAASDNVLRAGLTTKPVHVPLLLDIAHLAPSDPLIPAPLGEGDDRTFYAPAEEFRLAVLADGHGTWASGPRIVVALDGTAHVTAAGSTVTLSRGQAVFVPDSDGPVSVEADGMAAVASVPEPA
jgi:mannose-6-phosphate isomerase